MTFLLSITYASGLSQTLTFASAFERGLFAIALANFPVVLRFEDRAVSA